MSSARIFVDDSYIDPRVGDTKNAPCPTETSMLLMKNPRKDGQPIKVDS